MESSAAALSSKNWRGPIHQRVHGSRWIMLPSAAGFVDPLLLDRLPRGTGYPANCPKFAQSRSFVQGELPSSWGKRKWNKEMHLADELIGALYLHGLLQCFATTTLIYFASVNYAKPYAVSPTSPWFLFSEDASRSDHMLELLVTIRQQGHERPEAQKWRAFERRCSNSRNHQCDRFRSLERASSFPGHGSPD